MHSSTLGFFPVDAFDQHAARGWIIVAVKDGTLLGYLLFRIAATKRRAAITHLCVDDKSTGLGIARKLVDELKQHTTDLLGIGLWCRRDYEATRVWPRLGFMYRGERPGRGRDGAQLGYWWYDHGHPDLFTFAQEAVSGTRLRVALDVNVFLDLEDTDRPPRDSLGLAADWLQEHIVLCVTPEMHNELSRNECHALRAKLLAAARHYDQLVGKDADVSELLTRIERDLGPPLRLQDDSDHRQLAYAAAAGADYFATRDTRLLDAADQLFDSLGIRVLRPAELVVDVDSLQNARDYSPRRLAGCAEFRQTKAGPSLNELADLFLDTSHGEKRHQLVEKLARMLASPESARVDVVTDPDQQPIAIVGSRTYPYGTDVEVVRVRHPNLAPTLTQELVASAVRTSVENDRLFTIVSDSLGDDRVGPLVDLGFRRSDAAWWKLHLRGILTPELARQRLLAARERFPHGNLVLDDITEGLETLASNPTPKQTAWTEQLLAPLKLDVGDSIPSFIVPIQPRWAARLFDIPLAEYDMFTPQPHVLVRHENVYYRAARRNGLTVPARILWYVSRDSPRGKTIVSAVRAVSYLDEMTIDNPKPIFRRFERLGAYQWAQVFELAGNDLNKPVMAMQFSHTECLRNPISFGRLMEILQAAGQKRNQLQSVLRVPDQFFRACYQAGTTG